MSFFTYKQNNSGGKWEYSEFSGISRIVVIEADTAAEADFKAEIIGLYFDGVRVNLDCKCCGDRWSSKEGVGSGSDVPTYFGHPLSETVWVNKYVPWNEQSNRESKGMAPGQYEGFIHYASGKVEGFGKL